jgi:hypothetical protein
MEDVPHLFRIILGVCAARIDLDGITRIMELELEALQQLCVRNY